MKSTARLYQAIRWCFCSQQLRGSFTGLFGNNKALALGNARRGTLAEGHIRHHTSCAINHQTLCSGPGGKDVVCLVQHGQDHSDSTGCECVDEVATPQAHCEHMPRIKPCRREPSESSLCSRAAPKLISAFSLELSYRSAAARPANIFLSHFP